MIRAGLVRNPLSWRNRHDRAWGLARDLARDLAQWPDLAVAEPRTHAELRDELTRFSRRNVDLVIIDGGDGTVRDVLTALPEAYGQKWPALSIVASGKTNVIASDVGATVRGARALRRLLERARGGIPSASIRRRPVLELAWRDDSHPPARGMFLGAAAFSRAVALAQRKIYRAGIAQAPAILLTIMTSGLQAALGRHGPGWRRGVPIALTIDGAPGPEASHFLFLATTLERLVMGIWPFWSDDSRTIRWLDVKAEPTRLAAAFLPVMRGRPRPWMKAHGYHSGSADRLTLAFSDPFVLDGEFFDPGPGGVIQLSATRTVAFVAP